MRATRREGRGLGTVAAVAVAVVIVGLGSLACSTSTTPASGEPIEIGIVASMTGDLAAYGKEVVDVSTMAFDEINRAGGMLGGRPLKAYVQDDGTRTDGTKAAYATVLARGVPVVIGTTFSGGVSAIADQIRAGRTLTITPSATSAEITTLNDDGFLFRTAVSDAVQGVVLAQLVADAKRVNLCLVHRDDPWGSALARIAGDRIRRLAPETVVVDVPYSPSLANFDDVMDPCESVRTAPDAGVLFLTYVPDGALILENAGKRGWSPAAHKLFFGDGIYDPDLLTKVPDPALLEGALGTTASGPDPATPIGSRAQAFEDRYRARYARAPTPFAANIYDAAYVAAAAIELARNPADREAVAKAALSVSSGTRAEAGAWDQIREAIRANRRFDYQGASGNVDFDPATGDILPPNFIAVWSVANRKIANVRIVTVDNSSGVAR